MSWLGMKILEFALKRFLKGFEGKAENEVECRAILKRREVENWLYGLSVKKQTGWRAKTTLDDTGLHGAQVFLKSRWLDEKVSKSRP